MKYHIDTIPVWDAYDEKGQCPLCVLEHKSENEYVDFFLSGSVMEPSTRIDVNRVGFCGNHFKLLYKEKNRLGLALITHTHLRESVEKFKKLTKSLDKDRKSLVSKLNIFSKSGAADSEGPLNKFLAWLNEHHHSCMICDRLENLLDRYAFTILHLWRNDSKFKETLKASKGFCLHHLALIMKIANETLSSKVFEEWANFIIPIELETLNELDADLLWFTQKFDYRNQDKPWGNSKDALPRTLQTLSGNYMEPPTIGDNTKKD